MATTVADLLNARLKTENKGDVVSAINEINTRATEASAKATAAAEHSGNASIHVTSDDKTKIASIKDGTTSQKGLVQLNDNVNSTSTAQAATANAVKKAYDLASAANSKTVPAATTAAAGIVQLNDTTSSTSVSQAVTARALKEVNDKVVAMDNSLKDVNDRVATTASESKEISKQVVAHRNDYVSHPGVATTTNNGNAYAVTLNPAPANYVNGMGLILTINTDSTGPATINVNGRGAKAIKSANGEDAELKANGIYTLRYNATTGNFITQGEGGGGSSQSFAKVTVSDIQPSGAKHSDIWIQTGNVNQGIYFYTSRNEVANINVGDVMIQKLDMEIVKTNDFNKSNVFMSMNDLPTSYDRPVKYFSTETIAMYVKLGQALRKLGLSYEAVNAYYYNGSTWVQFSNDSKYILMHNSVETQLILWDFVNGTIYKTISVGLFAHMYVDQPNRKIILSTKEGTNFIRKLWVYDYELNLTETVNLSTNSSLGNRVLMYDHAKRIAVIGSEASASVWNLDTSSTIATSNVASMSARSEFYDPLYNRLILGSSGNGAPGDVRVRSLPSITTTEKTLITPFWSTKIGLCNNDSSIFVVGFNGDNQIGEIHIFDRETLALESSINLQSLSSIYAKYNIERVAYEPNSNTLFFSTRFTTARTSYYLHQFDIDTMSFIWTSSSAILDNNYGNAGIDTLGNYYVGSATLNSDSYKFKVFKLATDKTHSIMEWDTLLPGVGAQNLESLTLL